MIPRHAPLLLAALAFAFAPFAAASTADVAAAKRGNARFYQLHASHLERAAAGPVGVLFLGDSITEGWARVPEVWESAWGAHQPANFGIGGDRTEHVLWRIDDGALDRIKPRVVVLMIGTNNSGADPAADIAAGVRAIVSRIREKLPESKVLLLAIFPRGPRNNRDGTPEPWEMRMERIRAVNTEIAALEDGNLVRFLDIGPKFMTGDGAITKTIMPDQLHLSPAGYQIWAEAMTPLLSEMLK